MPCLLNIASKCKDAINGLISGSNTNLSNSKVYLLKLLKKLQMEGNNVEPRESMIIVIIL